MRALARGVSVLVGGAAVAFGLVSGGVDRGASQGGGVAVPVDRATAVKVMPLGDSNTAGADSAGGGYRTDLWQLLKADGRLVDFVGSVNGGSVALGDKDHEGHGGWTIGQIQGSVGGWLATYKPDVVMLQIGTNDMYDDASAGAAPGKLSTLIDTITSALPDVQVFVTTIPQLNHANHYSRVAAFNATIPGIAAAKVAAGKRVTALDAGSVLYQPYDFVDMWHPNYGAASKAAARWYTALTGVPLTRHEAEQTANATVTRASRIQKTAASGGGKVGYIDYSDSSVAFHFEVGAAGTYRIRARGANGTGASCTHLVSANGGPNTTVTYPSYSWDLYGVAVADVALMAGKNTVKFTKGACFAELDAIDVSPVPTA